MQASVDSKTWDSNLRIMASELGTFTLEDRKRIGMSQARSEDR